jgi:hypothetical protein
MKTFVHVLTQQYFELGKYSSVNLAKDLIGRRAYIALDAVGNNFASKTYFDVTSTYNFVRYRWYVPCSVKYPRLNSIFRILSVEL